MKLIFISAPDTPADRNLMWKIENWPIFLHIDTLLVIFCNSQKLKTDKFSDSVFMLITGKISKVKKTNPKVRNSFLKIYRIVQRNHICLNRCGFRIMRRIKTKSGNYMPQNLTWMLLKFHADQLCRTDFMQIFVGHSPFVVKLNAQLIVDNDASNENLHIWLTPAHLACVQWRQVCSMCDI